MDMMQIQPIFQVEMASSPDFFSRGCSRMVWTAGASEKEFRLMVLKHICSGFMAASLLRMSAVLPVPAQAHTGW